MEGASSPQPEDLRQQVGDSPSLTLSQNEEDVRDYQSEPSSENITLPEEEVPPSFTFDLEEIAREEDTGPTLENISISEENQETASEETKSPGLDFWTLKLSQSELWVRRIQIPSLITESADQIREDHAGPIPENVTTEEAQQEHQEKLKRMLQNLGQMLKKQNAK